MPHADAYQTPEKVSVDYRQQDGGSWKLESAKECVTTHLANQLALEMDDAVASGPYPAVAGSRWRTSQGTGVRPAW